MKEEYSERLSNDEELSFTSPKNAFFMDKQIKSSRRYLHEENEEASNEEDADIHKGQVKALPNHEEEAELVMEQDIMPQNTLNNVE